MFEQAFKNIDDVLWKEAGCTTELDYTEQTSWLLGDVYDIGSSKRIYESDWTSSGVPFYGGREIVRLANSGQVISGVYISEKKYLEYSSKYDMPQEGDILMTARGTIGVGYVVRDGDKFYYKDGNVISSTWHAV